VALNLLINIIGAFCSFIENYDSSKPKKAKILDDKNNKKQSIKG